MNSVFIFYGNFDSFEKMLGTGVLQFQIVVMLFSI